MTPEAIDWLTPAGAKPIILASASRARRAMLARSGVAFDVATAPIDESAIKDALRDEAGCLTVAAADVAEVLAQAKAMSVSEQNTSAMVIGSDQVLELDGELLSKPEGRAGARRQLRQLSGRAHRLHSAAALAIGGAVVWSHVDTTDLTMRALSDEFIDAYLDHAGEDILYCVGAYQIESVGVQLFGAIEGDYFTILGMPLLPLLAELRRRGQLFGGGLDNGRFDSGHHPA